MANKDPQRAARWAKLRDGFISAIAASKGRVVRCNDDANARHVSDCLGACAGNKQFEGFNFFHRQVHMLRRRLADFGYLEIKGSVT